MQLIKMQAEEFYKDHKEKLFYSSLCEYMTSGPVVVYVLSGENAVAKDREVMGATNPVIAKKEQYAGITVKA